MIRIGRKKKPWYQENWNEQLLLTPFQSFKKNSNNQIFIWLNIQPCKNGFLLYIWKKVILTNMPR